MEAFWLQRPDKWVANVTVALRQPSARGRAGAGHRRLHRGLLTVEDTLAALEMARSAKC
jgi:hypothetical protein